MNKTYVILAPLCCMLIPALAITSGCNQPAAAPAKTEGLAPVPPQPAATPQPATPEPAKAEPAAPVQPAAPPAPTEPKVVPAATAVPLTNDTESANTDAPNLIPEGSWEEGYPGWQPRGKAEIATDDKEKLVGARSLRLALKGSTGFDLVRWEVAKGEVKEGNKYRLKGFLKTQDVDPEASVYLTAFAIDSKTKQMTWFKSPPFSKSTAWTEVEVPFEVPTGGDSLAVRIEYAQQSKKAAKGGTVWVDDVSVLPVTEGHVQSANLIANGDFEAFTNNWTDLPEASHLALDAEVKQLKGSASLRVDLKGLDKAFVMQWLKGITPNTTYRLDGYVRTKDVEGNAFFTVMAENSTRMNKAWISTEKVSGTSDWRKLALQVKTADDTDTLAVRFEYRPEKEGATASTGTVWIDNISLTKVE